jgi:hypothetical protein
MIIERTRLICIILTILCIIVVLLGECRADDGTCWETAWVEYRRGTDGELYQIPQPYGVIVYGPSYWEPLYTYAVDCPRSRPAPSANPRIQNQFSPNLNPKRRPY